MILYWHWLDDSTPALTRTQTQPDAGIIQFFAQSGGSFNVLHYVKSDKLLGRYLTILII
jgi:hypothetical protein